MRMAKAKLLNRPGVLRWGGRALFPILLVVAPGLVPTCLAANPSGIWLVDESGVKLESTMAKIPLFGVILGPNAARTNVAWIIDKTGGGVEIRIPERDIRVSGLTDNAGRIFGSGPDTSIDIAYDDQRFTGTLILLRADGNTNGRNAVEEETKELRYTVEGALSDLSLRQRSAMAQFEKSLAAESEPSQSDTTEITGLRSQLANETANRNRLEQEIADLRQTGGRAMEGKAALEAELRAQKQTVATLDNEVAVLNEKIRALDNRNGKLSTEVEELRGADTAPDGDLLDQLAKVTAGRDAAVDENQSLGNSLREAQADATRQQDRLEQANVAADKEREQRESLETRITDLESENEALNRKVAAFNGDAADLPSGAAANADLDGLKQQIEARDRQIKLEQNRFEEEKATLVGRNAELEGRLAHIREQVATLESRLEKKQDATATADALREWKSASARADIGAMGKLLDRGLVPDKDTAGRVLTSAVAAGNLKVVGQLLDVGADPDSISRTTGWSALMIGARNSAMVNLLLEHGANVNFRSSDGSSVLLQTAYSADVMATRLLLDSGADPNLSQDDGTTPLMAAVIVGNTDLVKLLLEHDADTAAIQEGGGTAADIAREIGDDRIIELHR